MGGYCPDGGGGGLSWGDIVRGDVVLIPNNGYKKSVTNIKNKLEFSVFRNDSLIFIIFSICIDD